MAVSPRLLRAGFVGVDAETGRVGDVIPFQYNPDTLSRTIAPRAAGTDGGERTDTLRLAGPAVETIKLDAEFDGAPALSGEDAGQPVGPRIAALESLVNPQVSRLRSTASLADAGTLEITPVESPLLLFVWGSDRVVPVRITEFTVSEDAFTPSLEPVRAKVGLTLRVLNAADLPSGHRGAELFMAYRAAREATAKRFVGGRLSDMGVSGL